MENYGKKYKKLVGALKVLRDNNPSDEGIQNWVNDNVPELKESEYDRIRKEIIVYLKSKYESPNSIKCDYEKWITWLEKQGEKKPLGKSSLEAIKEEYIDNVNKVESKDYSSVDPYFFKTTDKFEPKFKIGDYLVNDYCKGKVIALTDDAYLLDTEQGIPFSYEHNAHLWTINDAKDGDVLAFDNDTIVMFKDLYNSTTFHSYCHIEDGIFDSNKDELPDWWEGEGFKPATKEQRDLLFQKMKEAGYEWDAEKKDLKIIDWSKHIKYEPNGPSITKENTVWGEEDEYRAERLLGWLDTLTNYIHHDAIVSLDLRRERMQQVEQLKTWLKSLEDRIKPQWKPSEEQMEVLTWCLHLFADQKPKKILKSLIDDLKNNPYRD